MYLCLGLLILHPIASLAALQCVRTSDAPPPASDCRALIARLPSAGSPYVGNSEALPRESNLIHYSSPFLPRQAILVHKMCNINMSWSMVPYALAANVTPQDFVHSYFTRRFNAASLHEQAILQIWGVAKAAAERIVDECIEHGWGGGLEYGLLEIEDFEDAWYDVSLVPSQGSGEHDMSFAAGDIFSVSFYTV